MSRYYDSTIHRFVNADGYFQTGSNILDVNMNIYCRNNPVMYTDPSGEWYKEIFKSFTRNVLKPAVKKVKSTLAKFNGTLSTGIGISGSPTFWNFGFQGGISIDTKGNVALQGTVSTGITGGSSGISVVGYRTITNAPDIDRLNGFGCDIGGSVCAPVYNVPIVACGELNIMQDPRTDDLYFGNTTGIGVGTPGIEGHINMSNTVTWDEGKFNVFNVIDEIEKKIEE